MDEVFNILPKSLAFLVAFGGFMTCGYPCRNAAERLRNAGYAFWYRDLVAIVRAMTRHEFRIFMIASAVGIAAGAVFFYLN